VGEPAARLDRLELGWCRAARPSDENVHAPIMRAALEASLWPTCEPGENLGGAYPGARRGVAQW
jgi:hypothetical protein